MSVMVRDAVSVFRENGKFRAGNLFRYVAATP